MDRKKINLFVSALIMFFTLAMAIFNFIMDDYELMVAYVIAFCGWLLVFGHEGKVNS